MKNRSLNLALSSVVLAGLGSLVSAQTVSIGAVNFSSNPGNLTNAGTPSGGVNTLFTASVSSGFVLSNFVDILTANVVSNGGGTFQSEAGFRMENSAFPGQSAYFNLIDGNVTYGAFSISSLTSRTLRPASSSSSWGVPATLLAGAAIPAGSTWLFEAYESFDDILTGADATGTGITFVLGAPQSVDLGTISASNSTLTTVVPANGSGQVRWYRFTLPADVNVATPNFFEIWTASSGAGAPDTEIGLFRANGTLVASNDDFIGLWSDLSFGSGAFPGGGTGGSNLAAGTYYVSASIFATEFGANNWAVTSFGPASVPFNLNLATSVQQQPNAIDLGVISASNSTLTRLVAPLAASEVRWYKFTLPANVAAATPNFFEVWTSGSGAGNEDTEIGLYRTDGTLVANNDDFGFPTWSNLSFGSGAFPGGGLGASGSNIGAGTYYLSVSKFNTAFGGSGFNVGSTASASIAFNLKLATSVAAPAAVNLTGTLNLNDTGSPFAFNRPINYAVKQGTTTVTSGVLVRNSSSASFTISVPGSATGTATIELDGSSFLLRKTNINLTGSNVAVGNIAMQNGDVDNSGEVDAADIDEVIADFGDTSNNPSDVDVSGEVDAADIDIVIANFGGTND